MFLTYLKRKTIFYLVSYNIFPLNLVGYDRLFEISVSKLKSKKCGTLKLIIKCATLSHNKLFQSSGVVELKTKYNSNK